jgi:hypothetical protein
MGVERVSRTEEFFQYRNGRSTIRLHDISSSVTGYNEGVLQSEIMNTFKSCHKNAGVEWLLLYKSK